MPWLQGRSASSDELKQEFLNVDMRNRLVCGSIEVSEEITESRRRSV